MASAEILVSVDCTLYGVLGRKMFFTRGRLSSDEDLPACGTGRLDASQVQPAFAARSLPEPGAHPSHVILASGEIFASDGCKFCGLLPRKIQHTRHLLSWDGDMPACEAGRRDASQMQPILGEGSPPRPRAGRNRMVRRDASQVQPAFTARSLPQPRAGTEKK